MDIHCSEALYFVNEKTNIGLLTQLALDEKTRVFTSTHIEDQGYSITFGEYSFLANLKNGKGRHRKKLFIDGCVTNVASNERSFFDDVNINGKGYNGWELRPPQRGAGCLRIGLYRMTHQQWFYLQVLVKPRRCSL